MKKNLTTVITSAQGQRVLISAEALQHSIDRHFPLIPEDIVLEVIERVLKDPTDIYLEQKKHLFYLFYRFDSKHYIVVIVKETPDGNFFVTTYPTGTKPRTKHRSLKRIRR